MRAACLALVSMLAGVLPVHADESASGAPRAWSGEGVSLEVTALASEGTAAFLMGRGVPSERAREYADHCVLRVFLRGEDPGTVVAYDVRRWSGRSGTRTFAVTTREDWLERWRTPPLEPAARTGFVFSQFPSRQSLSNGDSVQGLLSVPLPPGSRFDLRMEWSASGIRHEKEIQNIACVAP